MTMYKIHGSQLWQIGRSFVANLRRIDEPGNKLREQARACFDTSVLEGDVRSNDQGTYFQFHGPTENDWAFYEYH